MAPPCPAAGHRVEGHRQRLGQGRRPQTQARRHQHDSPLVGTHVGGERAVGLAASGRGARRAQRGPAVEAGAAGPASGRRTADHRVADRHRTPVARHGPHDAGPLVATDRSRPGPTVEGQVQVGAAHAAVADRSQHLRPGRARHRPVLDPHVARAVHHRGTHRRTRHDANAQILGAAPSARTAPHPSRGASGQRGAVRRRQPASGPPPAPTTATSGRRGTWRAPASPHSWRHASWRKP